MIKAIIFDFGGVITPIEPFDGWTPTQEERSVIHGTISEIAKLFGEELEGKEFSTTDFEKEFRTRTRGLKKESADRIITSLCTPNQELLNLISKLSTKYKIYGLVNAPFGWTETRRKIHGLDKYFGRVFVSYQINIRKPDPRIFQYLLDNINLKSEECLFVDDKEENILTAKRLGMSGYVFDSSAGLNNYLSKLGI